MLQPVMTVPSAVSSAAPTLKCEKAASACSRARRAAADQIDVAGAVAAARRGPSRRSCLARRSPSARPMSLDAAVEAGAAIGFDARAAVVEQQAQRIVAAATPLTTCVTRAI